MGDPYTQLPAPVVADRDSSRHPLPGQQQLFAGQGSRIEIIDGSALQYGGPKAPRLHVDEVELMDPDTWEEAQGH